MGAVTAGSSSSSTDGAGRVSAGRTTMVVAMSASVAAGSGYVGQAARRVG
jgi:hypothetical protein